MKTIEQQTAETILQKPQTIKVGAKTYQVAPPSTATLILISEEISKLPDFKQENKDDQNILQTVLAEAKDFKTLGTIAAILIIGAKQTNTSPLTRWVQFIFKNRQRKLATLILREYAPKQLKQFIEEQLSRMEIGHFFGITTFLKEVSLLKRTREVDNKMTPSGQPSQQS